MQWQGSSQRFRKNGVPPLLRPAPSGLGHTLGLFRHGLRQLSFSTFRTAILQSVLFGLFGGSGAILPV